MLFPKFPKLKLRHLCIPFLLRHPIFQRGLRLHLRLESILADEGLLAALLNQFILRPGILAEQVRLFVERVSAENVLLLV